MIEIVFGDSACGSLKMAQHYGEGAFGGGAIGVFLEGADGERPTQAEIQAAQQEAEARARLAWAQASPLGGDPADVYGLGLSLSIGDISEPVPGEKRRQVLEWLYGVYPAPETGPALTEELMKTAENTLTEVDRRISAGECVRIWYSSGPDELCGMYWFMYHLTQLDPDLQSDRVVLVRLPDWEVDEEGEFTLHSGWGSIHPGKFHRYLDLQKPAHEALRRACAAHWQQLQRENAPLRAMLNGRLVSAPETLYDECILREIEAQGEEFQEAVVVGKVLGNYQLAIGDAWVAQRIEQMIRAGRLTPVTEPPQGSPIYHRRLKKSHRG